LLRIGCPDDANRLIASAWPTSAQTSAHICSRKGGLTKNKVDNAAPLDKLREIEPGKWQKVYKDGMIDGKKASLHYFESPSGKVFDPAIKPGWSNR
jgi:hypothetical protein